MPQRPELSTTKKFKPDFRLAAEVGVREGRDERDRRPRHLALLRLALPHGAGRTAGPDELADDHRVVAGVDRRDAAAAARRRRRSVVRRCQKNHSGQRPNVRVVVVGFEYWPSCQA